MADKKKAGAAIAQLIPYIIAGVNITGFIGRPITQMQLMVLFAVYSRGAVPLKWLAAHMHVSMPTMSGIVERLVTAGYLERFTDPADRRQVIIRLSARGEKLTERIKSVIGSRWQEVLSVLNQDELERFYRIVIKLTVSLREKY